MNNNLVTIIIINIKMFLNYKTIVPSLFAYIFLDQSMCNYSQPSLKKYLS